MHAVIERLHQPEYTGENRCLPCTLVNAVIGAVVSGGVAWAVFGATGSFPQAALAGTGVLLLSAGAIGLRGYLVPGTPALTKRYLPESVLRAFGKTPGPEAGVERAETDGEFDVERLLFEADVVAECADVDDLCLTSWFESAWLDRIDERGDPERERLFDLLGVESGDLTVEDHGDSFRALLDGQVVGTWESRAAFEADLGAGDVLEESGVAWERLDVTERGQVLAGLRLFLETCPSCGGPVAFATETRESCCTSREVAVAACQSCDARVFESRAV